jgi:hypothetical protein
MLRDFTARLPLALFLALATTSQARAQLSGSITKGAQVTGMTVVPLGQRNPDALLLSRPAVQDELKLTPEQKKKLARLEKARLDRSRQFGEMAREVNQNEFGPLPLADIQSFEDQEIELNDEVATTLGQILSPRQRMRLAQISLQVEGAMAFGREDVLEKLNVDELQLDAIRTILDGTRELLGQNAFLTTGLQPEAERLAAVPQEGVDGMTQGRPNGSRKAAAAESKPNGQVLDEALRKIARVLRKSQWETYTRLKGPPFDLARLNGVPTPARAARSEATSAEPRTSTRKSLSQRRGDSGDEP